MKARVTLSTTTHGNGERIEYLKRNIAALDDQEFTDWIQYIVVDHSPLPVVQSIKKLVLHSKYPHRRKIIWLHGKRPTGIWGKYAHNIALQACSTEYFAFYCDDNFYAPNHLSTLVEMFDSRADYGFVFSFGCHCRTGNLFTGFKCGEIDLGCPLFRTSLFRQHLPSLAGVRDVYTWDWEMISFLAFRTYFDTSGLVTFFFGQKYFGNWRNLVNRYRNWRNDELVAKCRRKIADFKGHYQLKKIIVF